MACPQVPEEEGERGGNDDVCGHAQAKREGANGLQIREMC